MDVQFHCREQGAKKVMCWAAVVQGKVLLHWFEEKERSTGDTYLKMLQEVLWPPSETYQRTLVSARRGPAAHAGQRVAEDLPRAGDQPPDSDQLASQISGPLVP